MFENYSIWDKLQRSERPIFLYGTGNGGDKIIAALQKYGIKLDGIFASDGFVRDRMFHEFKVRSYSDIVSEYGCDIVVLLAFGTTIPEVCEFIDTLNSRHELIIPDVPLYGGEIFDYNYFIKNRHRIEAVMGLLADDRSRKIFCDLINFRLTGKIEYLSDAEPMENALGEIYSDKQFNTVLDGGAFKGDSTKVFADVFKPAKIIAVDADPKTFMKLKSYSEEETRAAVEPINAALWSSDGTLEYVSSASRGSGESGKNKRAKVTSIPSRTIDSIIGDRSVDFIKLDIEGAESTALDGACEVLRRCEPDLAVSLYHKTDDVFDLTERIHETLPSHKLYLRRVPCIPFWDLTLYAKK
ncbi:MAG: FkbM family methyltransferase [Ruminococcaceae bacterium]|nr:FkbM family methyltransferase [Oscillospiraceae bacterium]